MLGWICVHACVLLFVFWRKGDCDDYKEGWSLVLLCSSSAALTFLRGWSGQLCDKFRFDKTKQLVDLRYLHPPLLKPDLFTATLYIHKYSVDSVLAVKIFHWCSTVTATYHATHIDVIHSHHILTSVKQIRSLNYDLSSSFQNHSTVLVKSRVYLQHSNTATVGNYCTKTHAVHWSALTIFVL